MVLSKPIYIIGISPIGWYVIVRKRKRAIFAAYRWTLGKISIFAYPSK